MYISLKTIDIWQVEEEFSPTALFAALKLLLLPKDVLVIGAYNPCDQAYEWLAQRSTGDNAPSRPYADSFDLNRSDYPRGRAFRLAAEPDTFIGITRLLDLEQGSLDKPLFFDHLLCYRPTEPVIPLINFHDAFSGGALQLSGLYAANELRKFFDQLGVHPVLIGNPELPK